MLMYNLNFITILTHLINMKKIWNWILKTKLGHFLFLFVFISLGYIIIIGDDTFLLIFGFIYSAIAALIDSNKKWF